MRSPNPNPSPSPSPNPDPNPSSDPDQVHEHTRDDGTKQKRYLVASRKDAPLDAKVTHP